MWYQIKDKVVTIAIFAKPNAKRSAFIAIVGDEMQIALHAKPIDGEANSALIKFMSDWLGIPKSQITLLRGQTSRHKIISVPLTSSVQTLLLSCSR